MYSDRLLNIESKKIVDLFEKDINQDELNLTAGRSVVCVDREVKVIMGFMLLTMEVQLDFTNILRIE